MEFTPEQELLRESVRGFAAKEMPDGFSPGSGTSRASPRWRPTSGFADAGFMGVGIPEQYGGQGGGIVEVAIVLHELSRAMIVVRHNGSIGLPSTRREDCRSTAPRNSGSDSSPASPPASTSSASRSASPMPAPTPSTSNAGRARRRRVRGERHQDVELLRPPRRLRAVGHPHFR